MSVIRRCLGCSATDEHACPKCGSHAAEVEVQEETEAKSKPPRQRRKT